MKGENYLDAKLLSNYEVIVSDVSVNGEQQIEAKNFADMRKWK